MGRPKSNRPTDSEMEILRRLWVREIATVRDIQDDFIASNRNLAYTSIATIMRIMVDKGLVVIQDARRPQRFKPVITEAAASKSVTDEWLERMFDGSVVNLVRHSLADRKLSKKERAELHALLKVA